MTWAEDGAGEASVVHPGQSLWVRSVPLSTGLSLLLFLGRRPSLSRGRCSGVRPSASASSSPRGVPALPAAVSSAALTANVNRMMHVTDNFLDLSLWCTTWLNSVIVVEKWHHLLLNWSQISPVFTTIFYLSPGQGFHGKKWKISYALCTLCPNSPVYAALFSSRWRRYELISSASADPLSLFLHSSTFWLWPRRNIQMWKLSEVLSEKMHLVTEAFDAKKITVFLRNS